MYDRILFPTDGSETATSVFEYVLEIATTHDTTVHVLNVVDTTQDGVTDDREEVIDTLEREGERYVGELAGRASDQDVSVVTAVRRGVPDRTIVEYGEASGVDLVVMPTHGRSDLDRFLLGSVTERVVNTAPAPVLTVTPDATDDAEFTYPCRTVLVPTDGSQGADLALEAGTALANASGATLHLLHVVETASLGIDVRSTAVEDELEERANELLETARETARASSVQETTTSVAYGRPFREILSYVETHDVDAVVLGTQGETDFSRYTLGGVSTKLLRISPVPVLLIRDGVTGDLSKETTE
jgi:nucleotide-binding universal stress UspA family protein